MTAAALLDRLRERGVTVFAAGDRLEYEAPPGVVTPKVLGAVKDAKPALLALLAEEDREWAQVQACYRKIGETTPEGAIPWAEANCPALLAVAEAAEAVWADAWHARDWDGLGEALAECVSAHRAVAVAFAAAGQSKAATGGAREEQGDEGDIEQWKGDRGS